MPFTGLAVAVRSCRSVSARAGGPRLGALLETCLANIPQGNREVMVLRDVLELDTAETAACLGLSEEAVRVRLHRARAMLREYLIDED